MAELAPGSAAPSLEIKEWIKGEPIAALEPDQTYVIDFWATWCGPCIESMPHLTELARQHKDVHFIGVGILENNENHQVQKAVEKLGDKIGYTVGYSGNKDGMARSWMAAAKQTGIPTAFIVKNGMVMWIGHPVHMDAPLEQIIKNEFDVQAARKKYHERLAAREAQLQTQARITEAVRLFDSGETKAAREILAAVEQTPAGKSAAEPIRFSWLCVEEPDKWRPLITERMEKSQDHGDAVSMFLVENALRAPTQCKWLFGQLTARFADNWYPWLCGARMCRKLKEYDTALNYADKSRAAIMEFRRANPTVPEGNALEVIQALEEEIKAERK